MKDLTALEYCIDHAFNISGVSTRVYNGKVPAIDTLRNPTQRCLTATATERRKSLAREIEALRGFGPFLGRTAPKRQPGIRNGGVDFHKSLIESNRRQANGILWAAYVEVPEGDVQCELTDEAMK
jgi:hypothetical protein